MNVDSSNGISGMFEILLFTFIDKISPKSARGKEWYLSSQKPSISDTHESWPMGSMIGNSWLEVFGYFENCNFSDF